MTDGRLTRRTVLAGAAAVGAAGVLSPVAGLADVLERQRSVFSMSVGSVFGTSAELLAPGRFVLLGVEWARPDDARIELRTRQGQGGWSRWVPASVVGHGPDHALRSQARFGDPVWSGPADRVELRSARPVHGMRIHFINVAIPSGARASSAFPMAQPVLDAGPGQPPIIARVAWSRGAPPSVPPSYGTVKLAFVHHTENPNGYGESEVPPMLLAIYQFHRFVRGWNDIGYNFVIDLYGRIWEARQGGIDQAVIGAQAGGYNAVSTGVAVLGTFTDVVPSTAAIDALERLLAWKLSLHGVPTLGRVTVKVNPSDAFYTPFAPGAHVSLPRVAGHRDGDSTSCPGNAFYDRLPAIRPHVAQLAGTPARLRMRPLGATVVAPAAVALSGRLTVLHGGPLDGAPVEIQQVSRDGAATVLSTTTAADGSWTASVQLTGNAALQALHCPAPAAVSDLAEIAVAPSIELTVASLSPLTVSGQVFPSKRHVVLDLYSVAHGHRRLVTRKRVAVRQGRFAATVPVRRSGRHELIARTRADAHNAAGASAPVAVE